MREPNFDPNLTTPGFAYVSGITAEAASSPGPFAVPGDGSFDIEFLFPSFSSSILMLVGSNQSVYRITGNGITAQSFNFLSEGADGTTFLSAIEVRPDDGDPGYFGAVVPEPSTSILLGLGLTALGFFSRRRK